MAESRTGNMLVFEKAVASTGTAVELYASTQRVSAVTIIAKSGNTGQIYVGGPLVTTATNNGLDPGASIEIPADNWMDLNKIWLDADVSGNGVDFYARLA